MGLHRFGLPTASLCAHLVTDGPTDGPTDRASFGSVLGALVLRIDVKRILNDLRHGHIPLIL